MKTLYFLWTILLFWLFWACSDGHEDLCEGRRTKIRVDMQDAPAKTRLSYNDSPLQLRWSNGDVLSVAGFDAEGKFVKLSDFTLTSGAGTSVGIFSGMLVEGAVKYVAYFKNGNLNLSEGIARPDYSEQRLTQTSQMYKVVYDYALIRSVARGGGEWIGAGDFEKGNFSMRMVSSLVRFDFNLPDEMKDKGMEKLVWTNNWGMSGQKSVVLVSQIPVKQIGGKRISCYLCFEGMDLEKGNTFGVEISNSEGHRYVFLADSEKGKKYLPGGRSVAVLDTWNKL